MQTQLVQLSDHIWVIQGGANIGLIAREGRCLIIDSGMDKDAGRDILHHVKKLGLTPLALLVTHAHADHFGGAHYLVQQTGLKVYATRVEASVMSSPILEPLYLFSGAQPPKELQHKFLLARPCPADTILHGNEETIAGLPLQLITLPGHSTEQVGVVCDDTYFVGDAFLTPAILDKHRIPFYTDIEAGLTTLARLKKQALACSYMVAGHGEIYTSPAQADTAIDYTIARLESILEHIRAALDDGAARSTEALLRVVAIALGAELQVLPHYVLAHTTVQSALGTLYGRGEVAPVLRDNSLLWQRLERPTPVT